jgi:hypothetical protein
MSKFTREQLEEATRVAAQVVEKYGDVYLPIFNRMLSELEKFDEAETQKAKIKEIVSQWTDK